MLSGLYLHLFQRDRGQFRKIVVFSTTVFIENSGNSGILAVQNDLQLTNPKGTKWRKHSYILPSEKDMKPVEKSILKSDCKGVLYP